MKKKLRNLIDPKMWEMPEEAKERYRLHVMAEAERKSSDRYADL